MKGLGVDCSWILLDSMAEIATVCNLLFGTNSECTGDQAKPVQMLPKSSLKYSKVKLLVA
jgi:hypothetical protein